MTDRARAEKTRDAYLRRVYGITLDEYRAIVKAQGGRCPVCRKPLHGISCPVDHSHKTGEIRGVTCLHCNHRVIGRHTDWQLLARAAEYLASPPARRAIGSRRVPKRRRKRKKTSRPVA